MRLDQFTLFLERGFQTGSVLEFSVEFELVAIRHVRGTQGFGNGIKGINSQGQGHVQRLAVREHASRVQGCELKTASVRNEAQGLAVGSERLLMQLEKQSVQRVNEHQRSIDRGKNNTEDLKGQRDASAIRLR